MVDLAKVHQRSVEGFNAAYQNAAAEYQQAALAEDVDGMAAAAQQMAALRASMRELNSMASEYVATQRQATPSNRYGLSEDEVAIARNWTSDNRMSEDEKLRTYAEQRQRYRQARADGSYRDDQGTVRR